METIENFENLSEDPGLTTYFFLGVMGCGEGDIQMCDGVVVDGTPQMGEEVQC